MSEQNESKKSSPHLSRRGFLQASAAGLHLAASGTAPIQALNALTGTIDPMQAALPTILDVVALDKKTSAMESFFYEDKPSLPPEAMLDFGKRYIDKTMEKLSAEFKLHKIFQQHPHLVKEIERLWPDNFNLTEEPYNLTKEQEEEYWKIYSEAEDNNPEIEKQAERKAAFYLAETYKTSHNFSDEEKKLIDILTLAGDPADIRRAMGGVLNGEYIADIVGDEAWDLLRFGRGARANLKKRNNSKALEDMFASDAKAIVQYTTDSFQKTFPEFTAHVDALHERLNTSLEEALRKIPSERKKMKSEKQGEEKTEVSRKPLGYLGEEMRNYIDAAKPYVFKEAMRREQSSKENQQTRN